MPGLTAMQFEEYWAVHLCLALAGLAACGAWVRSGFHRYITAAGVVLIVVLTASVMRWTHVRHQAELLTRLTGTIQPVPMEGAKPSTAMELRLGSCTAQAADSSFVTVIRIAGKELLSVERSQEGLLVNASVFSSDGRIVAQVVKNQFTINQNNYFKMTRATANALTVLDQSANVILDIEQLNPTTVKILGTFSYQGKTVDISDNVMNVAGIMMNDCVINVGPSGSGVIRVN